MKITIKRPIIPDIAFILYFTYVAWRAAFRFVITDTFADPIIFVIMLVAFTAAIIVELPYQNMRDVLIMYCIVIAIFAITYLLNTNVRYCYWDENWGIGHMIQFSSGGIWAYLAVRLIPDKDTLLSNIKIVAYITLVYNLLLLMRMFYAGAWQGINNQGEQYSSQYNMAFGYDMIFVAIVFLYLWTIRKKCLDFIIMVAAAACAFIWGSRGALLCMIVAILLLLLIKGKENNLGSRIAIFLIVVVALALVFIFSDSILNIFNNLLGRIGFSSRTLQSLTIGTFTQDASRTRIWTMVFEQIKGIFPFGYGAFGDRPTVMPYYVWGYSHNIILEMIVSFGILGLGFLAWLIYYSLKIIWQKGTYYIVAIIMLSMSVKLMVSDSFWFNWAFWALLAICISNLKINRNRLIRSIGNSQ